MSALTVFTLPTNMHLTALTRILSKDLCSTSITICPAVFTLQSSSPESKQGCKVVSL